MPVEAVISINSGRVWVRDGGFVLVVACEGVAVCCPQTKLIWPDTTNRKAMAPVVALVRKCFPLTNLFHLHAQKSCFSTLFFNSVRPNASHLAVSASLYKLLAASPSYPYIFCTGPLPA